MDKNLAIQELSLSINKIYFTKLFREFEQIFDEENRLWAKHLFSKFHFHKEPISSEYFYGLSRQLYEVARAAFVPRSYNVAYNLVTDATCYESVSAHTNLVIAIIDKALMYVYGANFGELGDDWPTTSDGYTYRQIIEAARLHDLPENKIGDIPDNGTRNEAKKLQMEAEYYEEFADFYPNSHTELGRKATELVEKMGDPTSATGRLLYLSDKIAAILITLACNSIGTPPVVNPDKEELSEKDLIEIGLCDYSYKGYYRASEMWTADMLQVREIIYLDDTRFFTGLLVMYTLIYNRTWYNWRKKMYQ